LSVKLSDRSSVPAVIKAMTIEEKAQLITGAATFSTTGIERLGIPSAVFTDGGGGVNLRHLLSNLLSTGQLQNKTLENLDGTTGLGMMARLVKILDNLENRENLIDAENELLDDFLAYLKEKVPSGELPSCFPANMLLGATWDPEVPLACARAVGKEASAFGVDMLLGTPCINIQRDPLGGRGFESYSEDPYLISKLAPNYCIGVQEAGVIADVKHFAANNQETERMSINEIISERALYEIYLPAFKACVQEGGVKNVMTGYNWINGVPCAENKWLLEDVLRDEWGFDGFVVSDWGGVYDQVKAIKAGNDVCMPGPRSIKPIVEAIKNGDLDEKDLDKCVERYLNVLVEMPVMKGRKYTDIDSKTSKKVAYEAALQGITLLKNENSALPLKTNEYVSFFGEKSLRFFDSGVGSGRVHTNKTSSLFGSANDIAGDNYVCFGEFTEKTQVAVISVAASGQEGCDRVSMTIDPEDEALLHEVLPQAKDRGIKVVLVLNVAGPIEMMDYVDDVDAILCVYFPGQEGARATADLLYGLKNPCGHLPQTFPKYYRDCPSFGNFPGEYSKVYYGEGIFVGYRWYDKRHIEPLFPFGHGLSYTTFELSNLRLSDETFLIDEQDNTISLTLSVKNTGCFDGATVVQLYISDEISSLQKPEKELKGFKKVFLRAGESQDVMFTLSKDDLSSFDTLMHAFVCEPGYFNVQIGLSSRDIRLCGGFYAQGKNPYGYGPHTLFKKINDDPRARKILLRHLPKDSFDDASLKNLNNFSPYKPFKRFFNESIAQVIPEKMRERVFAAICEDLSMLDVSGRDSIYKEVDVY
jgi:beta-glucosidase